MSSSPRNAFGVRYTVPRHRPGWELHEGLMPESGPHDEIATLLVAILAAWAARADVATYVGRNRAVRWDEAQPQMGVDPDVSVFAPAPPDASFLRSMRTWVDGQAPPILAIEVVSETNPHKDYSIAPDKYAASGTGELWIFDPLMTGPPAGGGPHRLQIWHRQPDGDFVRVYAGEGPARSPTLGAYLVPTDEGRKLRIADDANASRFWLTDAETERAAKEAAVVAKGEERVAKEAALARVAELEASIAAASKSR